MRIEIAGEGANARHTHKIGACDLVRERAHSVAGDGITLALHFTPARAIQVKRAETRVTLSVEEVFALFDDVISDLGLSWAEVQERLDALRQARRPNGAALDQPPR